MELRESAPELGGRAADEVLLALEVAAEEAGFDAEVDAADAVPVVEAADPEVVAADAVVEPEAVVETEEVIVN